jgi:hypothetical protein
MNVPSNAAYRSRRTIARGNCPLQEVTGEAVDISEYLDVSFYYHVSYAEENAGLGETRMRRMLGVSHRVGGLVSYLILTQKGAVMSRTTVQRVTNLETQTGEVKSAIDEFDNDIRRHSKEDDEYGFEASKPNPEGWSEYMGVNSGFEASKPNSEDWSEQFDQPMNDP